MRHSLVAKNGNRSYVFILIQRVRRTRRTVRVLRVIGIEMSARARAREREREREKERERERGREERGSFLDQCYAHSNGISCNLRRPRRCEFPAALQMFGLIRILYKVL